MSRSVPIEDPLLHPPTPPIQAEQTEQKQDRTEQPRSSLQFDDGPIPFQTTSSTEATAKNTSIFAPIQAQPLSKPNTVPVKASAVGNASETEAASLPKFVDPLTAAALEQNIEGTGSIESTVNKAATTETTTMNTSIASVPSSPSTQGSAPLPNISIPTGHNNIPTEYPTHLASPPLPQRPSSRGGTPFAAFQSFSSALQPPSASEAPVSTDLSSGLGSIVGGSIGLSFKESQQGDEAKDKARNDTSTTTAAQQQQRAKQNPIGISTANIAGTGIGSIQDQSDMVHQELRSPEQQHHALEQQQEQQQQQHQQQQPQHRTERNSQMTIKLVEQGREQYVGIRSPVFAVPQRPMRQEGFPVLNTPSMFHEITMSDALNDLMIRHIPAEQRVLRDWNALTKAEQQQASRPEILHELTVNNSWRAMARYTRSQILNSPPERIPELINLWYARLLALTKLGQYEMAQAELDQLGDLRGAQYRYESYPADMFVDNEFQTQEQLRNGASRTGSMVPFELFVLKARLQGYLGDVYEAIDQLYDLIMNCKKFEAICHVGKDTVGARQWHSLTGQLHLIVLNYLIELKDYSAATRYGRDLARAYPQDINFHSGLGRLYLQLGDLERAEKVFKEVEEMVAKKTNCHSSQSSEETETPKEQIPALTHLKLQVTTNRALLAVAQGQWAVAKAAFEEVLTQEPENLVAANNLAVCELYAGQLNEAIPRLERLMFAYPTSAGTSEPLVFNMATLYELRTEGSLRRKQQMMIEVSKWAGDQFNVSMFKI